MWLKPKNISFPFVSESDVSLLTELGDFSPCGKSVCQAAAASVSESHCPWKSGLSHLRSDENSFNLKFLCGCLKVNMTILNWGTSPEISTFL